VRRLLCYFQLLAKDIFEKNRFEEDTKNLNRNDNHTRKVVSLICFFRFSIISFCPSPVLPLALVRLSISFLAFSESWIISAFVSVDIRNGFAVGRWRGVPRFSFFSLSPVSSSIVLPAKNIRAIIPRRRCLALGCL